MKITAKIGGFHWDTKADEFTWNFGNHVHRPTILATMGSQFILIPCMAFNLFLGKFESYIDAKEFPCEDMTNAYYNIEIYGSLNHDFPCVIIVSLSPRLFVP